MAAARITFRDNRQQQLKVEVTLLVRVYPSLHVCVQRHSGVPTKIVYTHIFMYIYIYIKMKRRPRSNRNWPHPLTPNRSPTPKPPASRLIFVVVRCWCNSLTSSICLIINIIKGRRSWAGDLIFNVFVLIEEIGCRIENSVKFSFWLRPNGRNLYAMCAFLERWSLSYI